MPVSLQKLFGHDSATEQLPAELRTILSQMRQERAAFEALQTRAQQSTQQLSQLVAPVAETQQTVNELQARVKSLERLVPVLATLDEQTEGVARRLKSPSDCGPRPRSCARVWNRPWR
jgi:peptidoglycan hydrolase CwlO-like protein